MRKYEQKVNLKTHKVRRQTIRKIPNGQPIIKALLQINLKNNRKSK